MGAFSELPESKRDLIKQSNQGKFPNKADSLADAAEFLRETIKRLQPTVVAVMGSHIPGFMVPEKWKGKTLAELRTLGPFERDGTLFISVYHPSARGYAKQKKDDAGRIAALLAA